VHLAVHHRARAENVCARPGILQSRLGYQRERPVVAHVAVLDHAAVAVGRVLAEADVGGDDEGGKVRLELPDRPGDDPVAGVRLGARLVLGARNPEEEDGIDALLRQPTDVVRYPVDGVPAHARHGGDRFDRLLPVPDEDRGHQVRGMDPVLPEESPDRVCPSEPPVPCVDPLPLFKHLAWSSRAPRGPRQRCEPLASLSGRSPAP